MSHTESKQCNQETASKEQQPTATSHSYTVKERRNQACATCVGSKKIESHCVGVIRRAMPHTCSPCWPQVRGRGNGAHTPSHSTHHHTVTSCVKATSLLHVTKRLCCNGTCSCYCACVLTLRCYSTHRGLLECRCVTRAQGSPACGLACKPCHQVNWPGCKQPVCATLRSAYKLAACALQHVSQQ